MSLHRYPSTTAGVLGLTPFRCQLSVHALWTNSHSTVYTKHPWVAKVFCLCINFLSVLHVLPAHLSV